MFEVVVLEERCMECEDNRAENEQVCQSLLECCRKPLVCKTLNNRIEILLDVGIELRDVWPVD